MRGQVNESRGVVESRGSILSGLAPGCKPRDGAGKQIEKHGNNVHELRSSDFIGAWIGSCQERRDDYSSFAPWWSRDGTRLSAALAAIRRE